ncbi:aldolase/citrate lyase family protein [Dactylosporangium sp. NPDC051484]|uniref:HpcH/HpaI aldolase family protein n=1 Tax=Dactylosporangium sp. NPDC051484 TaxID=3154942 RepID=UPI00344FB225
MNGVELRDALHADRPALGAWSTTGNPFSIECMGAAGFDFLLIDLQHSSIDVRTAEEALRAAQLRDCATVVRLPGLDPSFAGRVLDLGANALLFPTVESARQAADAVAACRYPPAGVRSFGPFRASLDLGREPAALTAGVSCMVMVETVAGIEAVEEIAAVDGIGAIWVGPSDLALSMGLAPSMSPVPGDHQEAISRVRRAANDAGVLAGIPCLSAQDAWARWCDGFRLVTTGSDVQYLRASSAADVVTWGRLTGGESRG